MPTMQEVRAKYPQYEDMSDEQLAGALHRKFYSDMPFDEFAAKVGLGAAPQAVAPGRGDRELGYGETALDMLKSAGTGIAQGAIGIAGLPRDVGQWAGEKATGLIDSMMGASDQEIAARRQQAGQMQSPISAPSAQGITQAIEGVTGPMYQPQSTAGEYARTVGEFIPGAAMGPGGLLRKGALAVAPGVASEAAGQATEGSDWEPYARVGGALLGGGATAAVGTKAPMKQMLGNAPTQQQVQQQTSQIYDRLRNAGIKYDANGYGQFVNSISQRLVQDGLDPMLHPKASRLLERVMQQAGNSPEFKDIDTIRKVAGEVLRGDVTKEAADMRMASVILKELDAFTDNAALISNGSVPAGQVAQLAGEARELARRNILARQIGEMDRKSEFYVSGQESGLRNQFGNYLKSSRGKGLTEAEKAAFKKVTNREGILNIANSLGSRLNTIGAGAAGVASAPFTGLLGPAIAGGAMLGNLGVRKGMEVLTKRQAGNALKTVLAGKDAQRKALSGAKKAKGQARGQTLLATDSGRRSASQEPMVYDANGRAYPYSLLGQ